MRTLEDESEEDLTAGGGLDLLGDAVGKGGQDGKGGEGGALDDGRPAWMKQLADTASEWLSLVPKVSYAHRKTWNSQWKTNFLFSVMLSNESKRKAFCII